MNIEISKTEDIPDTLYSSLLEADPSQEKVNDNIQHSSVFIAKNDGKVLGIILLRERTIFQTEIVNLSVLKKYRGKGIASQILSFIISWSQANNYKNLYVCTGTTSFEQMYLYQKCGFRFDKIERDYFVDNYQNKIIENKLRLKDRIQLKLDLN
ncbi:GNAT family N-acetyltransferase [Leuconostoc falkenbergense]|uniref:GNAT family N-acetyltransferase n=1 Tax=Leuconostoc falkenbergense TaxID=2766470 RepID=UPI0024ACDD28|nr:GNAT family N-acetyltransferase [Leuconostoc falkenbergense]MDI6666731.1 GNAT family N-acetyltransferase [Leuconostoc falkenbergense]